MEIRSRVSSTAVFLFTLGLTGAVWADSPIDSKKLLSLLLIWMLAVSS